MGGSILKFDNDVNFEAVFIYLLLKLSEKPKVHLKKMYESYKY